MPVNGVQPAPKPDDVAYRTFANPRVKQARSVKFQITIAKLPQAKELYEFDFEMAQVNETLIRDQAIGDFLDHRHNLVLIGGNGTGKTHLAVRIART